MLDLIDSLQWEARDRWISSYLYAIKLGRGFPVELLAGPHTDSELTTRLVAEREVVAGRIVFDPNATVPPDEVIDHAAKQVDGFRFGSNDDRAVVVYFSAVSTLSEVCENALAWGDVLAKRQLRAVLVLAGPPGMSNIDRQAGLIPLGANGTLATCEATRNSRQERVLIFDAEQERLNATWSKMFSDVKKESRGFINTEQTIQVQGVLPR
jgi:hypothetical protein